jgi:hypothetical protein
MSALLMGMCTLLLELLMVGMLPTATTTTTMGVVVDCRFHCEQMGVRENEGRR